MTPSDKLAARAVREQLALLLRQPEAAMDLAQAALLVAAEEEPRCDVAHYRARLYELGVEARARLAEAGETRRVSALNEYVFGELGFVGNQGEYYDVRNSLLNEVIERRTGIPITLSIVYMEIGRRAGLEIRGVGLPGHFIVRVAATSGGVERATLVDPFYGTIVDKQDCQQRLDTIYGGQVPLSDEHLRATPPRQILVRLLRNLKSIYTQAHMHRRALACVERILLVEPRSFAERRDRATLLAELGRLHEALEDLQSALKYAPDATDAEALREQLKRLRLRVSMLN